MMSLRPATMRDFDLLLGWRNDEETRCQSGNPKPVSRSVHRRWMMTHDDGLFVAELDGAPVGTIRLDRKTGEVHLTVSPECRGHGHATEMLNLIRKKARSLPAIWGRIKMDNVASKMAFFRAGFKITMIVMERVP